LAVLLFFSQTDTGIMKWALTRVFSISFFTIYCNFGSPCIQWVFYSSSEASKYFHDEFVRQYHLLFPEHLEIASQLACSSQWRVEGYIYRNALKVPAVDSVFGILGARNRMRTEIAQLNLSIYDVQIPDRDAEHILIEYSVSDQQLKKEEIIYELAKALNKQFINVMQAQIVTGPIQLRSSTTGAAQDDLEFWLEQEPAFKILR
tara:strand:+ start:300 stop:911 length:612 start_codon:yes stop_codon:yes gene_type:complete